MIASMSMVIATLRHHRERRRLRACVAISLPMSADQRPTQVISGSRSCALSSPINAAAEKYSSRFNSSVAGTAGGRAFCKPVLAVARACQPGSG